MNYKLYALIFTLSLVVCPALQAMRALRVNSLLVTARSMRQPLLRGGSQALTRAQSTQSNDHKEQFKDNGYAADSNFIPAAGAVAVGLAMASQHAMEEEPKSRTIEKLDIYDIKVVLEIFRNGSEDDKQQLAQRVAQKITNYSVDDVISLLVNTALRPHRTLVNALTKNITYYTPQQIALILQGDAQDETHELFAFTLKKNYTNFTSHTFGSYVLFLKDDGFEQYGEAICSLNDTYRHMAIQPLLDDFTRESRLRAWVLGWDAPKGMQLSAIGNLERELKEKGLELHKVKKEIIRALFAPSVREITFLYSASELGKQDVVERIVQKINQYKASELYEILCIAGSHVKVKAAVTTAFAQNINNFIHVMNGQELVRIIEASDEQSRQLIIKGLLDNVNEYHWEYFERFLTNISESVKERLINEIAHDIDRYNTQVIRVILYTANKHEQEVIVKAISDKVNIFISEQGVDSQSAAHLRINVVEAWEYISTIAYNPEYKAAFQKALKHEHAISEEAAIFYHSQRCPVYWLELLYTKLWEQKYQQNVDNYLFTRFPDDQTEFSNAVLQSDGQQKRTLLLKRGRLKEDDELRPYLLFVNYALFGNSTKRGSCSAYYFINNFNVGDPEITTQSILDKFGNQAIFGKYKKEFVKLEEEFKDIVSNSILLQLAIPYKALNEHVYLSEPGGYKKKLRMGGKRTDDVSAIINALKANPHVFDDSDGQEFCVVMTPNAVHTLREQGAQVRVYGDFDQAKLDALIKKLEALIARIAKENPKTFSGKMTPAQSYRAYKPVLDELIMKKD